MARKKTLPLIEDFNDIPEEALVPEAEQPYRIPDHWKWVRLGAACVINPSKKKLEHIPENTEVTFIPMAAVSDVTGQVENSEIRNLQQVSKGYTSFSPGDVLFAKITPCMENGKAAIVPELLNGLGYGSTEFFVLRPSSLLSPQLLHTFIRQKSFRTQAKESMTGAVGQQRVPKKFLEQLPFPLPPLYEQQQIVEKLSGRLQKVDEVTGLLEKFLEDSTSRAESLLEAALQGHLTKDWRNTNNQQQKSTPSSEDFNNIPEEALVPAAEQPYPIPDHWKWVRWRATGSFLSGSGFPRHLQGKKDGDFPFFKVGNLKDIDSDSLLKKSTDYISDDTRKKIGAKIIPEKSLVFAKIGEAIRLNRRALLGQDSCIDNNMFAITSNKLVSSNFLLIWAKTVDLYPYALATAVPSIRKSVLEEIPFPLPPLDEQKQIVEKLSQHFQKNNEIVELVKTALSDLSDARQSLISAALAGRATSPPSM